MRRIASPLTSGDGLMQAFGLRIDFGSLSPPGAWVRGACSGPALRIEVAEGPDELEKAWTGLAEIGWQTEIDGALFAVEIGRGGDHRFVHGDPQGACDVHHLSADRRVLRCAPEKPEDPLWWRVVLDSVLFVVALLHGYQPLHAAAVLTPAGAIAITAPSGGGKSTLLSELLRRGLPLFADDIVVLEPQPGRPPIAHPAPPLMTVSSTMEINGLGPCESIATIGDERWIALPVHHESVPLAAVVVLDRREGVTSEIRPISKPLAPLVTSLLCFPPTLERDRARFEFAGELSERVPLLQLSADPAVPPHRLATLLATQQVLQIGRLSTSQPITDLAS